jgi:hypothetical protein
MTTTTHALLGPIGASLVLIFCLASTACSTDEKRLRVNPQQLAACQGTSVEQLGWEQQRRWQRNRSDTNSCVMSTAPRCEVQTAGHITRYRCE